MELSREYYRYTVLLITYNKPLYVRKQYERNSLFC